MKHRAQLHPFVWLLLSLVLVIASPGAGAGVALPPPTAGTCGGTFAAPNPSRTAGVLTGRVLDVRSGEGLTATVLVVGQSSVWSGATHYTGWFAANLPPGAYTATVQRAEFKDFTRKVVIRAGKTTRLDVKLRPDPRPVRTRPSGATAKSGCGPASVSRPPSVPGASGSPDGSSGTRGSGSLGSVTGSSATPAVPSGGGAIPTSQGQGGSGVPEYTPPPEAGPAPSAPQPGFPVRLKHTKSVLTAHGNAAWPVWSDDNRTVFLANEEGVMAAVKIDVSNLRAPRIAATNKDLNFLWYAAQRGGLLVMQPSIGAATIRLNPSDFTTVWRHNHSSTSHSVATDGAKIYVPLEGNPGVLKVLSAEGTQISSVNAPQGWWRTYGIEHDASTNRLYVGVSRDPSNPTIYPGGVYIFGLGGGPSPLYLGMIPGHSPAIAAKGNKLWRSFDNKVERWDVTNPASPLLVGTWNGGQETGPGGTLVKPEPGQIRTNATGTRLYVAYNYVTVANGHPVKDWHKGFYIFDSSGNALQLLKRQDWKTEIGYWIEPTALALSPDEQTLAVSYWRFGIRLFGVAGDTITDYGKVATTGEAHDVYVDNAGYMHVFANDDIQTIHPTSGEHVGVFVSGTGFDGQWRPFKDGTILAPGIRQSGIAMALTIANGTISYKGRVEFNGWEQIYEEPYMYSATNEGLSIHRVGTFNAVTKQYPITLVGSITLLRGPFLALVKSGTLVWMLSPASGVVAIDVSIPSSPRLAYHDSFTFFVNGNHAGIVAARDRIYAGAGDKGLIVYDPRTLRRTTSISGLNVNFLDVVGNGMLAVANYWYTQTTEGLVLYDIRRNPDAPEQVALWPGTSNANFRVRVVGNRIYRVPLYGVDVLEVE